MITSQNPDMFLRSECASDYEHVYQLVEHVQPKLLDVMTRLGWRIDDGIVCWTDDMIEYVFSVANLVALELEAPTGVQLMWDAIGLTSESDMDYNSSWLETLCEALQAISI
jgi:hypothetical protein